MSKLRAVLDRLNDIEATIARATSAAAPSNAVLLSLTSLEARRDDLEELSEVTKAEHVEICDYRIIPEQSTAYAVAGVTAALHQFQEIVTTVFDAMLTKPKQRAKIAPDIVQKTQFDFGFAYSGSLGVVLTIPNDRLLMDEASTLDKAVAAVFDLLKIETPGRAERSRYSLRRSDRSVSFTIGPRRIVSTAWRPTLNGRGIWRFGTKLLLNQSRWIAFTGSLSRSRTRLQRRLPWKEACWLGIQRSERFCLRRQTGSPFLDIGRGISKAPQFRARFRRGIALTFPRKRPSIMPRTGKKLSGFSIG